MGSESGRGRKCQCWHDHDDGLVHGSNAAWNLYRNRCQRGRLFGDGERYGDGRHDYAFTDFCHAGQFSNAAVHADRFHRGTTLTWSVNGVAGGNATVGTISPSGLYTAPAPAGSYTVTATDGSITGSATIEVVAFSVSPAAISINPRATQTFTDSLQGLSSAAVTWEVDGKVAGAPVAERSTRAESTQRRPPSALTPYRRSA